MPIIASMYGKKASIFSSAIDDLDHKRQVFGEPQNFRRVHAARMTETHRPAHNGRAGQIAMRDRLITMAS